MDSSNTKKQYAVVRMQEDDSKAVLQFINNNDVDAFRAWICRLMRIDLNGVVDGIEFGKINREVVAEMMVGDCPMLIHLMRQKAFAVFNEFLSYKPNLETLYDGGTALFWASVIGDPWYVEKLLAAGANVNAVNDKVKATPLFMLLGQNPVQLDLIEKMLNKGALLDIPGTKTPLMLAAELGLLDAMKLFLKNGANPNATDDNGITPIAYALYNGEDEAVDLLAEHGADINKQDTNGCTSFMFMCRSGKIESIRKCFKFNPEINIQDNAGRSAFIWSLPTGNKAVWDLLKEKGADLNAQDEFGRTPLIIAAQKGWFDACEWLLENGANPHIRDSQTRPAIAYAQGNLLELFRGKEAEKQDKELGFWGCLLKKALVFALKRDDVKLFKAVANRINAKTDFKDFILDGHSLLFEAILVKSLRIFNEMLAQGANPNSYFLGMPVLTSAANSGDPRFVRSLLKSKADVHLKDLGNGNTAFWAQGITLEIGQMLLDAGLDVNEANIAGQTPLMGATAVRSVEWVKWFCDKGADVNLKDSFGKNAMMMALFDGQEEIVDVLAEKDFDKRAVDKQLLGYMFHACVSGKLSLVQKVESWGGSVHETGRDGTNCLMAASQNGGTEVLDYLKSKGVDVNAQNEMGFSALIVATLSNNIEAAQWLLNNGADRDLQDKDGNKAIVFAKSPEMKHILTTQPTKVAENKVERSADNCHQM